MAHDHTNCLHHLQSLEVIPTSMRFPSRLADQMATHHAARLLRVHSAHDVLQALSYYAERTT